MYVYTTSHGHAAAVTLMHGAVVAFCSHFNDGVYYPSASGAPAWPVHVLVSSVRPNHMPCKTCPFLTRKTGASLSNKRRRGGRCTDGSGWYSMARLCPLLWIFCGSGSLTGVTILKRGKCFMKAACMLQWAWKDTSVCRGQYENEARLCEKRSNVCSSADLCTDG